jgi:ABC-type phosphate transport system permease subunit
VLPYATPGIVTGVIIGLSRALGETAPLIVIGLPTFVAFLPFNTPGQKQGYEAGLYDADGNITNLGQPMDITLARGGMIDLPNGETLTVAAGQTVSAPAGSYVNTEMGLSDAAQSWLPLAPNGQGWLDQSVTVLPMQMFNWTQRPEPEFAQNAAAAGIVLLAITLLLNGAAIWIRYRLRKRIKW